MEVSDDLVDVNFAGHSASFLVLRLHLGRPAFRDALSGEINSWSVEPDLALHPNDLLSPDRCGPDQKSSSPFSRMTP